jgi:hypothetical protein
MRLASAGAIVRV